MNTGLLIDGLTRLPGYKDRVAAPADEGVELCSSLLSMDSFGCDVEYAESMSVSVADADQVKQRCDQVTRLTEQVDSAVREIVVYPPPSKRRWRKKRC